MPMSTILNAYDRPSHLRLMELMLASPACELVIAGNRDKDV